MLTLRSIPSRFRHALFALAVSIDLALRVWAANLQAQYVSWNSNMAMSDTFHTIGEATAVAVPVMVAPLFVSPIAYFVGQLLIVVESSWVRAVSAVFIVASFVVWGATGWLSVFLAVLGYLILISGMVRSVPMDAAEGEL